MKKTVFKRLAALLLAIVLTIGVLPFTAAAGGLEVAAAKQKVKEVWYYDKNPDPAASGEI